MESEELKSKLKILTKKETSITKICETLEINKWEVLYLISELAKQGIVISKKQKDDDLYLYNQGEKAINEEEAFTFSTDDNHEFKFVAISDTRIGSKSQQLTILNDIYEKASKMGYHYVIHCGNLTEGLYPVRNAYNDTTFLDDSQIQVDYIVQNYPNIEGITTYFITSTKDDKHLKKNGINIGKRISESRDDMKLKYKSIWYR